MSRRTEHQTAGQVAVEPDSRIDKAHGTDPVSAPDAPIISEGQSETASSQAGSTEAASLRTERDQLLDRLARLQAEFDNSRKREQRERGEFRDYATANVIEHFLPVIDNFQLALKSGGSADQLRTGVELIVKQMEDILRNLNVQVVPTVGTQFDPRVHEALDSVERNDVPDHQVLDEVRRGYTLRDKMLRPALVRVAKNEEQKSA
ncbi:MAG TPA: nucleotide exchange factor GrpE [Acidobacteriaceae bacterium]|nr:nucleotide exchange factor GrpE [Acidobacteriaceae bacterium]